MNAYVNASYLTVVTCYWHWFTQYLWSHRLQYEALKVDNRRIRGYVGHCFYQWHQLTCKCEWYQLTDDSASGDITSDVGTTDDVASTADLEYSACPALLSL